MPPGLVGGMLRELGGGKREGAPWPIFYTHFQAVLIICSPNYSSADLLFDPLPQGDDLWVHVWD